MEQCCNEVSTKVRMMKGFPSSAYYLLRPEFDWNNGRCAWVPADYFKGPNFSIWCEINLHPQTWATLNVQMKNRNGLDYGEFHKLVLILFMSALLNSLYLFQIYSLFFFQGTIYQVTSILSNRIYFLISLSKNTGWNNNA